MNLYQFKDFDELLDKGKNQFTPTPVTLTIGNFDGVHLGHKAVLTRLLEKKEIPTVFTFTNHPSEVLHQKKIPYLTSLPHKLSLLEKEGVKAVFLIPFDLHFSKLPAEEFLTKIKEMIPFSSLILGHDSAMGHERKGNAKTLTSFAGSHGFSIEYVDPVYLQNEPISSSRIRKSIQEGNLEQAAVFLGRPFTIQSKVVSGLGKGKLIGFHTANLEVTNLCLPPFGVWVVEIELKNQHQKVKGIANLGHAPTVHENRQPMLEVHLLDFDQDLYNQTIEVEFMKFLRPEKRFDSIESLKEQIQLDISLARSVWTF